MAATNFSVQQYTGKYYNTNDNINDSASSVKNLYSTRDVIFHHDADNKGSSFCVASWWTYSFVGHQDNDRFSSHALIADNSAC